ncbi:hypothetical protein F4777DRAFT_180952 [Nemania sp. FL0916]|nr:hypothetical protein F4777DRAFT_180952 [Nemania sp. FL0916]
MSVQPVWSLGDTPGGILSVTRSIFQAATDDNIQPLAIIACEKFGNTLAICDDTRLKIEKTVVMKPTSRTINFLKAVVGFSDHDTATQLGRTDAGVRFLALAAALVTTMSPFGSGRTVEAMVRNTAADKGLLPTLTQFRDLLAVLEPRCQTCGFAESVLGWHQWLIEWFRTHNHLDDICEPNGHSYRLSETDVPAIEALEQIVNALRTIDRIGDAAVTGIEITAQCCIPWLIAFTKWSLGKPPSIYFYDGSSVLEQEGSQVKIFMREPPKDIFDDALQVKIKILHSVGSPMEFVEYGRGEQLDGMVSITSFGKAWLQGKGLDLGLGKRTLLEIIPFAVSEALQKMKFVTKRSNSDTLGSIARREVGDKITPPSSSISASDFARSFSGRRLPGDRHIQKIISPLFD